MAISLPVLDVWTWISYAGSAAVIVLVVEIWLKSRALPPGPWGLPIFGCYFSIHPQLVHVTLTKFAKRYGDLFSLRTIGGTLFIVLNGPTVIKEVLVSRAEEFIGRPREMNFNTWVDGGYGIVQTDGKVWKEQRRFFLSAAKKHGFGKTDLEGYVHELIQEMLDDLRRESNLGPLSLPLHLSHVTGNIIARILFSKKLLKNDPKFKALAEGNNEIVYFLSDRRVFLVGPILEHIALKWTTWGRKLKQTTLLMEKFAEEIVEEHIQTFDPAQPRDFIDSYLIHLKKLEDNGGLEDTSFSILRLKKIVLGIFLEAIASTSMCTMLVNLARHPDAQERAQKELDEVIGRERLPSYSDKKNLPYLNALILELFRSGIVFFVSSYHSNFNETTIGRYRIPERSFIIANFHSVHNDPKLYPNPSKFDPERFLSPDGKRIKKETLIPFGIGKRSCVGEALATMEIFLIFSSILQNFTLYPTDADDQVRLVTRRKPI